MMYDLGCPLSPGIVAREGFINMDPRSSKCQNPVVSGEWVAS